MSVSSLRANFGIFLYLIAFKASVNQARWFLFVAMIALILGCAKKVTTTSTTGCPEPAGVFTKTGLNAEVSALTIQKVAIGDAKYSQAPEVVNLFSQSATDARIIDHLVCLARERYGYNDRQVEYLRRLNTFMTTRPNAKEFMEWDKINKFPSGGTKMKEGYGFAFPQGTSIKSAITLMVEEVAGGIVQFSPKCSSGMLTAEIKAGNVSGVSLR